MKTGGRRRSSSLRIQPGHSSIMTDVGRWYAATKPGIAGRRRLRTNLLRFCELGNNLLKEEGKTPPSLHHVTYVSIALRYVTNGNCLCCRLARYGMFIESSSLTVLALCSNSICTSLSPMSSEINAVRSSAQHTGGAYRTELNDLTASLTPGAFSLCVNSA